MYKEGYVKHLIDVIISNTINATNMEIKDNSILNNHTKKKYWAKVYKARDKLINTYREYETASINDNREVENRINGEQIYTVIHRTTNSKYM